MGRNNRLEIAGQKSLCLAQTPNAHRLKVLLEEGASSFHLLRRIDCALAELTKPTTGIADCCARAASGHAAAAPPSVVKNFRRPMWLAM
jgi:hypothetical protein